MIRHNTVKTVSSGAHGQAARAPLRDRRGEAAERGVLGEGRRITKIK
jgi:hypothetical protein